MKKTFLITGGAQGIGACMVSYVLKLGHTVINLDIKKDDMLQSNSNNYHHILTDLSQKESMDSALRYIKSLKLQIDVIVHNACLSHQGIHTCDYDGFQKTIAICLSAPFYLTQQCVPLLSKQAKIIHISSTRAFQSQSNSESYAAAKAGLIGLTHALSVSLKGIATVNSISPGWIDTKACDHSKHEHLSSADHNQHPSMRVGHPMDVIRTVMFLAEETSDFINGQNIFLDGGMSKQMIYHADEGWNFTI